MNILDLDLKSAINYSIDAYTHIYGEEYRNIIKEKINNAIIILYCDPDDLIEYMNYLKECKCRELSIKYLRALGIETNIDNYSEPFSIELNAKTGTLVGPAEYAFRKSKKDNNDTYNKFHSEYVEFEKTLEEYNSYIKKELKRKKEIEEDKLDFIIKGIESILPNEIVESLKGNEKLILGKLNSPFLIEYFSESNINKLFKERNIMILDRQLSYFKNIGLKIDYEIDMINLDLDKYYKIFNDKEVQKYILSNDLISLISFLRNQEYKKLIEEYIGKREDYLKYKDQLKDHSPNLLYSIMFSKITGVTYETNNLNHKHTPILIFNIPDWKGNISRIFLHEIGHIIDFNESTTGFDKSLDKIKSGKRKYETFNETIVDIYANKAFEYLEENNVYLFESKENTRLKELNDNTTLEMKSILMPLIEKYNSYVIESRITGNPNILIDKIGLDNYEDLVNLLNELSNIKKANIDEIKTKTNQIYENIEAKVKIKSKGGDHNA